MQLDASVGKKKEKKRERMKKIVGGNRNRKEQDQMAMAFMHGASAEHSN